MLRKISERLFELKMSKVRNENEIARVLYGQQTLRYKGVYNARLDICDLLSGQGLASVILANGRAEPNLAKGSDEKYCLQGTIPTAPLYCPFGLEYGLLAQLSCSLRIGSKLPAPISGG